MSVLTIPTDVNIQGNLAANSLSLPSGCIGDTQVQSNAAISAAKLQHAIRKHYSQGSAVNATAATFPIHSTLGLTATVMQVVAGAVVAAVGADTCTVDVKKNGTSILSAPISLSSSQTARQQVAGTITTASLAVGDLLEVVITPNHSSGTLPQGVFVEVKIYEVPA